MFAFSPVAARLSIAWCWMNTVVVEDTRGGQLWRLPIVFRGGANVDGWLLYEHMDVNIEQTVYHYSFCLDTRILPSFAPSDLLRITFGGKHSPRPPSTLPGARYSLVRQETSYQRCRGRRLHSAGMGKGLYGEVMERLHMRAKGGEYVRTQCRLRAGLSSDVYTALPPVMTLATSLRRPDTAFGVSNEGQRDVCYIHEKETWYSEQGLTGRRLCFRGCRVSCLE